MEEKIVFIDDDGNEVEMFVIEETRINNVNYILVTDDDGESEEAEAYILKDVSDEVFLSQNYLSELFKKETGEGFYEFLSNYRVKKAKELLITTNFKIYEVAEKVGYNDSITFGRAFKKITGTTPNNFRNNKIKQ